MPRNVVVGLLAAVAAVMSALVGLAHADLIGIMIADAAAAGMAAYLALPPSKKTRWQFPDNSVVCHRPCPWSDGFCQVWP